MTNFNHQKLTKTESDFLEHMKENHTGINPLLRSWMEKSEIRICEKLVKKNLLFKGTFEGDSRLRVYYSDEILSNYILNKNQQ